MLLFYPIGPFNSIGPKNNMAGAQEKGVMPVDAISLGGRADFTCKSAMVAQDGAFRFTFFCELCDCGYTTQPLAAAVTVKEAFEMAQREARPYFNRCQSCSRWVCDQHYNEDLMLCTACAPRRPARERRKDGYL